MKSLTTSSSMFQATKIQDMITTTQTWQVTQSSQSRTTSTFLHDVSLRSVSNSKFWMTSRTLLSQSSLRDIWQQNEPQTTNRTTCKQCYPASAYTQDTTQIQNWEGSKTSSIPTCFSRHCPLLNSRLFSELSHVVLFESNEWTSSWQIQPTILSSPQQTNSGAFGILLRGIPAGTRSSPLSGRTRAVQMPLYPSPGHGDQWVTRTECALSLPRRLGKMGSWYPSLRSAKGSSSVTPLF